MTKNRSLFSLFIVLLLLSACAPAPPPETPTPTATIVPTATSTPLPTDTPTPTQTPTPEPPKYQVWQGEEGTWKLIKLDKEMVEVENKVVMWEEDGTIWGIEIRNTQGAENIRLLENNESKWPVVIGDVNGEIMAYDPLNEVFLPMLTNDFSVLYTKAEKAAEILVNEGVFPSLEELSTDGLIDWTKIDENPQWEGKYNDDYSYGNVDAVSFQKMAEFNLFFGGFFRLYLNDGRYIDFSRLIFNENKNSSSISIQQFLSVVGGMHAGKEISMPLKKCDQQLPECYDYPGVKVFDEIFSIGDYVATRIILDYKTYDYSYSNENSLFFDKINNDQQADNQQEEINEYIRILIYERRLVPIKFVFNAFLGEVIP